MKAHFRDASVPFGLGHIARYVPSPEGNICAPIMHFQCKNNFEHLLRKYVLQIAFKGVKCLVHFIVAYLSDLFGMIEVKYAKAIHGNVYGDVGRGEFL